MNSTRKRLTLLTLFAFLHPYTGADYTCGLIDLEPTSNETAIYLPPISDSLKDGQTAWEHNFFGTIKSAGYINNSLHVPYLGGTYNTGTKLYWFSANEKTQHFVKEMQTRELYRRIQITCEDGSTPRFSFILPIQDMTPPAFEEEKYTFNITKDWNLEDPISNIFPVIVHKKASPIAKENENMTFSYTSYPDELAVDPKKLWVLPNPSTYVFRLDIRLKRMLEFGQTQIVLSAIHGFTSQKVEIVVNVS